MQILWNELKKILTWKMLLLLVAVNAVMYFLFIEFYITHFPNGRPELDDYNISIEILEKYGVDIDEEDFQAKYIAEIKKVDEYLQSTQMYADAGLTNYQAYQESKNSSEESETLSNLRWQLLESGEIGDTLWELQSREYIISWIAQQEASFDGQDYNSKQQLRIDELKAAKQFPVFPESVLKNYQEFIFYVAITIILSVLVVVSPIIIKDRTHRLLELQYTSKKGRRLYTLKIIAGLLSAFIVITTLFLIYFSIYTLNKTSMFFDIPIHKFILELSWYDPTFYQYIVLTVLAVSALAFISTLFAMTLSSIVPNMIALIGVHIPYFFLLVAFGVTFLIDRIISIYLPQWLVPTAYGTLLVASVVFIVLMWKREKTRDLLL